MKKLVLTALSLSILTSTAYASRGDGADNVRERIERNHSQAQPTQVEASAQPQMKSREELDRYAGMAIKANPENSSSLIARESGDCSMCRRSAARAKWSSSATARKQRR